MRCLPIVRSVTEEAPHQLRMALELPATLPCFAGHFPNFPVLPGVVQLDWVMLLGAAHLHGVPRAATDLRVKFKRVITPEVPLTLMLRHDASRRRLEFTYAIGAAIASQGQMALSQP